MNLRFQQDAIRQLQGLADMDRHSLMIEGAVGCGKSYLAKQFATMLGVSDCYTVNPTVQSIRDAIDQMYNISDKVVLCIENLDNGVVSASHTLLKFLEEPKSNVYIVVTCRNRYKIPDTIVSRSTVVDVAYPTPKDIQDYAELINTITYNKLKNLDVWRAVKSLKDVDSVYKLTSEQLAYYDNIKESLSFKDAVSTTVWNMQHYKDGSETDLLFVMNFIMSVSKNKSIQRKIIECVQDLNSSRLAPHAVLTKFVFDCKYGA